MKGAEKEFCKNVIEKVIFRNYGGAHHLQGDIGRLRRMDFVQLYHWMMTEGFFNTMSKQWHIDLIQKYEMRTGKRYNGVIGGY